MADVHLDLLNDCRGFDVLEVIYFEPAVLIIEAGITTFSPLNIMSSYVVVDFEPVVLIIEAGITTFSPLNIMSS